ncbi:MAG TPA: lysophospholipid acyltransferase family protein [Thermoanaerobaculia bacterium]|jgi:1-acyl-sn-glycerol-3-phosphate acyltransferase|nr:lysophospholipid acyltransferase family protein [Thermoanaerobaculia bacterium]
MRRFIVRLFRLAIEVFYRRVEVAGVEHLPREAPVIFAANHPNGLIDPLFVLCYAPREVSFLAKAPLFRYPVIGWFVKLFDSIPVYRKQDNVAGSNEETFARAREVLERGGGVAIFPEGTTHSDARLRELKTGAARIALGASLPALTIVPVGIYYSAKGTFRSDVLVLFGAPMNVSASKTVEELTGDIERGLAAVTLQADSRAALELVENAEDIFSDRTNVSGEFALRKQFVDGYHYLCEHDPERLARLASQVTRFAEELRRAKLEPHELVLRFRAWTIVRVIVQLPIAAAGALLHYPTYRLVGFLAKRFSREETEMTATMKFIASLLFFPVTWIVYATVAYHFFGAIAAVGALVVIPLLGFEAYRIFETADVVIGRLRAMRRRDLVAARELLRDEFLAVARDIMAPPTNPQRKESSP